jgi:hypothetical protein
LIEAARPRSRRKRQHALLRELITLYGLALDLPKVRAKGSAPGVVTHEEWWELFERLRDEFGDEDLYWLVFEPHSPDDHEALCGSVADDVADIYRNLKDGLVNLANGTDEAAVFWEWRFLFHCHWGRHAVNAISALHSIMHLASD